MPNEKHAIVKSVRPDMGSHRYELDCGHSFNAVASSIPGPIICAQCHGRGTTYEPAPPARTPDRWHELKCAPEFFDALLRGVKPFEIRRNDRFYIVGDFLFIREFSQEGEGRYTGRAVARRVTYIYKGNQVHEGYVVLGVVPA